MPVEIEVLQIKSNGIGISYAFRLTTKLPISSWSALFILIEFVHGFNNFFLNNLS